MSSGKKINSRQKGKRGELELAHKLQEYGYKARRGQQYSGANSDADVVGLDDIWLEVKRVEQLNIYKAIDQAVRDSKKTERIPVVCHKKNFKQWLVTMRLDDWMKLYSAYEELKEKEKE